VDFNPGPARYWWPKQHIDPIPDDVRAFIPTIHALPTNHGIHWCGCSACHDYLVPSDHRIGVGHFSVLLGDIGLVPMWGSMPLLHCIELQCGPGGWALLTSTPHHTCAVCSHDTCTYRIHSDELSVHSPNEGEGEPPSR
jgi:hypothetical protein